MARISSDQRKNRQYSDRQRDRMKKENDRRENRSSVEINPSGISAHGGMFYRCSRCGHERFMYLEIGVEDHGKHGRIHQPCPFCIACTKCGALEMVDISGYRYVTDEVHPVADGMDIFTYDQSGSEDACGHAGRIENGKFVRDDTQITEMYYQRLAAADAGKGENG